MIKLHESIMHKRVEPQEHHWNYPHSVIRHEFKLLTQAPHTGFFSLHLAFSLKHFCWQSAGAVATFEIRHIAKRMIKPLTYIILIIDL